MIGHTSLHTPRPTGLPLSERGHRPSTREGLERVGRGVSQLSAECHRDSKEINGVLMGTVEIGPPTQVYVDTGRKEHLGSEGCEGYGRGSMVVDVGVIHSEL